MNCSTPGLPVHHQLLEFTQAHVHRVSDAIQPCHPLSSPSPPAPNPSQHQVISPKKTYRWPTDTWKNVQHHLLLEKCRSKPQWAITVLQSGWLSSESLQIINAGDTVEKKDIIQGWWEWILVQPLGRTLWSFLKKTKNRVTTWSCNPTPGQISRESHGSKDTCTPGFTAVLFTKTKTWKPPKSLLTDEWMKKMCYIMNTTQP